MDLPERLADDLPGAFPVLVDEYGGAVYTLALRLCGPDAAEEIAQDTFARAFAALGRYDADRIRSLALRPWVVTIALNVARNQARRRRRHPEVPLATGTPVPVGTDAIDRTDLQRTLAAALRHLSVPARQAVVLRHVLGFDTAETASMLGRPVGTVKAQVARSLATLRRHLSVEDP